MHDLATFLQNELKKDVKDAGVREIYYALLAYTKERLKETPDITGDKKVYYISAEFLIGKLLSNNLINLGIYDEAAELLEKNGKKLSAIEEMEPEPSLGNGGFAEMESV